MRTGHVTARILTTLLLALAADAAFGLELGLDVSTGNLQFPWEPVAPLSDTSYPGSFYFVGGKAWMATPLGEDAAIRPACQQPARAHHDRDTRYSALPRPFRDASLCRLRSRQAAGRSTRGARSVANDPLG